METLTQALKTDFGVGKVEAFRPDAVYFEDMDYVEYLEKDVKTKATRIDEFLTISRDRNGIPVGFVLKGFRNYFNRNLRDLYDFTKEDFISLMDVILMICKEKAAFFKTSPEGGDAVGEAYRIALSMTKKTAPKLSVYSVQRAA